MPRKALERLKFHPREALPNTTALARADALYVELVGPTREVLGSAIAGFRAALDGQVPQVIEEARDALLALVDQLAGAALTASGAPKIADDATPRTALISRSGGGAWRLGRQAGR